MSAARRRRVLVALHEPLLNGATIAVLRTVPLLEQHGWEFAFWVPAPGPAYELLAERGYRVAGRPRPIASGLQALREPPGAVARLASAGPYLRALARFARSVSPDLVHSNSLYSFAEALTCRAIGLPTAIHLHDMAPASWKAPYVRQLCRRGVNGCFAVSRACAASYETGGWMPEVVHGGAPVPERPAEVRERPRPFVVGTVGVVSQRKGSDLFVAAAERLGERRGEIEMRMIGAATDPLDRAWGEAVLERARRAGVSHRPSADVERAMRGWDAFVLPSRRDPFPLAMLEAMALGLPAIGARVDGIPEQLDEGGAGRLVPPEDPDALAAAISALAGTGAEDRAAIGRAARERVQTRFGIERLAADTDRFYRELLAT